MSSITIDHVQGFFWGVITACVIIGIILLCGKGK